MIADQNIKKWERFLFGPLWILFIGFLSFLLLFTSWIYEQWLFFTIGIVAFLAFIVGGFSLFRFLLPTYSQLKDCHKKALEINQTPESNFSFSGFSEEILKIYNLLGKAEEKKQRLDEKNQSFSKDIDQYRKEHKELKQNLEKSEIKQKKIEANLEMETLYFQKVLSEAQIGILFIDRDDVIGEKSNQYIFKLLGVEGIGEKFSNFLKHCKLPRESKQLQEWWTKNRNSNTWHPLPKKLANLPFGERKHQLQFSFFSLEFSEELLVFILDVTKEDKLSEKLLHLQRKRENALHYILEMVQTNQTMLENFVENCKIQSVLFKRLKDESNLEKSFIQELLFGLESISNNARLAKFTTIIESIQKAQTILKIIAEMPGELRLEQIQEIQEHLIPFTTLLEDYLYLANKILETSSPAEQASTIIKTDENISLLYLQHKMQYLYHSAISPFSSPQEFTKHMMQVKECINFLADDFDKKEDVFEFTEVFDCIMDHLKSMFQSRKIVPEISHNRPKTIFYGHLPKMISTITTMLQASLLRAEVTSGLKISSRIIRTPNALDILEIETRVTIRNTAPETIEMLHHWEDKWGKDSEEGWTLVSHKWGFCLQMPVIIDKLFASDLQIAYFGPSESLLLDHFSQLTKWFPFQIKIVFTPSHYDHCSLIIAEEKALETLSDHIQNKLKNSSHFIPIIALIGQDREENYLKMLQYHADECLPVSSSLNELRWCIMSSLGKIVSLKRDVDTL